jgi:glucosamine-6-phosphate deaminase
MGGTIDRLVEQGHEVRIVSLTSGSLRVSDSEADKFAGTLLELAQNASNASAWSQQTMYAREVLRQIGEKGEFGEDTPMLRNLKSLILRGELRDAAYAIGIDHDRVVFLDLPFYEKGRYRRFKVGDADAKAVAAQLADFKPHQIYTTGDAADPSSVSSLCFRLVESALKASESEEWVGACSVWLYRGKEMPLEPHEIDMAVPMSPPQLDRKKRALARYATLSSLEASAPEQNCANAKLYDALGMAEYEAIESFQRWKRV